MYHNYMVKHIKTKTDLNRIVKVLKENGMARYIRTEKDYIVEKEGKYYRLGQKRGEKDVAVDVKTLISEGLSVMVQVGNYKYGSTRRYDICKALGFELEEV